MDFVIDEVDSFDDLKALACYTMTSQMKVPEIFGHKGGTRRIHSHLILDQLQVQSLRLL